jgi:hypothetical protein
LAGHHACAAAGLSWDISADGRRFLPLKPAPYDEVMRMKEELAATLPDIRSLRDFVGCYLVHGHYLLQAARRLHLRFASMIDINVTLEFMCAAEEVQRLGTHIETVHADFREGSTFA